MVYRLSWIAGAAGIILALLRMQRLLRPAAEGPPWELALVASAALGAVITWTLISYRRGGPTLLLANGAALALASFRIVAPDSTWYLLPTRQTLTRLTGELGFALEILRHGTAPVLPVAGLVVLVAAIFWTLGALLVWGLARRHPHPALAAPILFYLQLAVIDHRPSGRSWQVALLAVVGAALVALAADQRRAGAGLLTRRSDRATLPGWRPLPATAVVALLALFAVSAGGSAAALVPPSGILDWRNASGLGGGYYGGVSYNPFIGIRQSLVSQRETPVFVARVEGDVDPRTLYWRLLSLDTFNGEHWYAGELNVRDPDVGGWEDPEHSFHGPTRPVVQQLTIEALRMEWLPSLYSPVEVRSAVEVLEQGFRVRHDGALRFDALTFPGLGYQVLSLVPQPDYRVLASVAPGSLSPLFERAAREGATDLVPTDQRFERRRPPDLDRYLELPDDLPTSIRLLARQQTLNGATDFERALLLEAWLRDPTQFTYSTDIRPGHSAESLVGWLLDPESPNFRTGYCEQFATAMAVMARSLGIPARTVLGFTPGDVDALGTIVVRERNAHAWVELWMPSQGWVRFDPTPRGDGQNPATVAALTFDPREYSLLPEEATAPAFGSDGAFPEFGEFFDPGATPDADIPFFGPEAGAGIRLASLLRVTAVLLASSLTLPAYKAWRRRRRLKRLRRGDVTAAWEEIIDRLSDLGPQPPSDLTPAELAAGTISDLRPLASVYAEAVYGPSKSLPAHKVALAADSLRAAESRLAERHPPIRRVRAAYSLRSLRRG